MLTRNHFLLPSFDLCLPRKRACFENPFDKLRELPGSSIDIAQVALKTFDLGLGFIAVFFCLCSNS